MTFRHMTWRRIIRDALVLLGIIAAVVYWWYLTSTGGLPVDVRYYWAADPTNLYPHPELAEHNGYNYSPAFEFVVAWWRWLPFDVFVAIWRASWGGQLSPMRTAISSRRRRSKGATAAAKAVVSMPSA